MADKTKRFRLKFENATEDVPRIIRAYGKACAGEFALVLRPAEKRGLLVLTTREQTRVWASEGVDAPSAPTKVVSAKEGLTLVKKAQVPGKETPVTLRGQWSGWLVCDGGVPRVELQRKLASYGWLRVTSGDGKWIWKVERLEKWFSKPGKDEGAAKTLVEAVQAGLGRMMGLLGEVCAVKDSTRRPVVENGVVEPVKKERVVRKVGPTVIAKTVPEAKVSVADRDRALVEAFRAAIVTA